MTAIATTAIRAELRGSRCYSALGIGVNAYAPVCALARALIRAGFPSDQVLEATAARFEVRDGSTGRPLFVPWHKRMPRTASQIAQNEPALPGQPPDRKNAPAAQALVNFDDDWVAAARALIERKAYGTGAAGGAS
jgi:hypothetical protein